jgi:hypothetical protein
MPAQQGFRRDDRSNVLRNSPPEGLGSDRQAAALVIVQPKSEGEDLCTQDSVLLTKVINNLLLFPIRRAGRR